MYTFDPSADPKVVESSVSQRELAYRIRDILRGSKQNELPRREIMSAATDVPGGRNKVVGICVLCKNRYEESKKFILNMNTVVING
jgi:hypothetical protein